MFSPSRREPSFSSRDGGTRRAYFSKRLLTDSEQRFFMRLRRALPDYCICPQVCMGALIDPPPHLRGEWKKRARYPFQSKMVDFVVWDADLNEVICLVELDDPTHDTRKEEDAGRDAMTAAAGYPTTRFDVRSLPESDALREAVLNARAHGQPAASSPVQSGETSHRPRPARQRGRGDEPSIATVLGTLMIWAVVALVGWKVGLPAFERWFVQQSVTHLAKTGRPVDAQPGTQFFARPAAPAPARTDSPVTLGIPSCMVYEDRTAIAQRLAQGCLFHETVAFNPVLNVSRLQFWYTKNLARLNGAPGCDPYAQWAQELMSDAGDNLDDTFQRLDRLFTDAIVKGCMRSMLSPQNSLHNPG